MSRCQNCNKFTALNFEEPEEAELSLDGTTINASVRIVRTSECCGDEMKEATLEMSDELPDSALDGHVNANGEPLDDDHELEVECDGVDQVEEGGGRFAKSYFGATVHYSVRCSCQKDGTEPLHTGSMTDKVAASHMDEV